MLSLSGVVNAFRAATGSGVRRCRSFGVGLVLVLVLIGTLTTTTTTMADTTTASATTTSTKTFNNGVSQSSGRRSTTTRLRPFTIRLCLVRHGETESNRENLVLGQSDSPLTEKGKLQAQALGRSAFIRETPFRRIYSSDLNRAVTTARIVLLSAGREDDAKSSLRQDRRLRETAKGAKEGLPKTFTYQEALDERAKNKDDNMPPLESDDDGWNRMIDWLDEVIRDAVEERNRKHGAMDEESTGQEEEDDDNDIYTVLVVSHSGLLRLFLRRFLGEDRLASHPDVRYESSTGKLRFMIPNLSLTVLDVRPWLDDDKSATADGGKLVERKIPRSRPTENVDIERLTWTGYMIDERPKRQEEQPQLSYESTQRDRPLAGVGQGDDMRDDL